MAVDDPDWRPKKFRQALFGREAVRRLPSVKLLDFAELEAELEPSRNAFAKVVLAHLTTQQTRGNPADRHVLEAAIGAQPLRKRTWRRGRA